MQDIVLKGICKAYQGKPVLRDFSAVLPKGEIIGMMAPSGAGKTTLLRILMGLETADSGQIDGLAGVRVSAVFQEDRLCAHLSAIGNIRLAAPHQTAEAVCAALCEVGLGGCTEQPVRELSGGMCRRTAILRALLADYDLLLLDEPFKGLDNATKELVMADTRRRAAGHTVLLVTHDEAELEAMGAQLGLELK